MKPRITLITLGIGHNVSGRWRGTRSGSCRS